MGYYGFGIGKRNEPRRPKKFLSKRTGLFDRQLKDDLMERHEGDATPLANSKSATNQRITEKRKDMFLQGISDKTLKFLTFILAAMLIIAFILKISHLI